MARTLAEHPDATIEATLSACPHCAHTLAAADQSDIEACDHIDLPAIRPVVTRIDRHRGTCPCCRKRVAAPAPKALAPGSPFGRGICAMVLHLHITQAIGFERLSVCPESLLRRPSDAVFVRSGAHGHKRPLRSGAPKTSCESTLCVTPAHSPERLSGQTLSRLMADLFGVSISEGAIANILARTHATLPRQAFAKIALDPYTIFLVHFTSDVDSKGKRPRIPVLVTELLEGIPALS